MLDLIDAARSRRNGQPKAWQEWPCHAVAALPPVGEARRRADAGTAAPKGEIAGLHPRAVFPREAALTRRFGGRDRAELGSLTRSHLPRPMLAKSVSGSTEFGKRARVGAPAGTARDALRPRPACRNRQLGLAVRAHESSGMANGCGAAGRPGERAVLRTHLCGQRCRSRNLDFAGGSSDRSERQFNVRAVPPTRARGWSAQRGFGSPARAARSARHSFSEVAGVST